MCVCVCLHLRLCSRPASREQGTTRVVSARKTYNMSKNSEAIFSAPANLKSNGWRSSGSYKKEGNIYKSFYVFLIV